MTLHEAILAILEKKSEPMKAKDIALEINKYSLYKSKNEKPITQNQVWARVNQYAHLFKISDNKEISIITEDLILEENFLKSVRSLLLYDFSSELDIIIPYLIILARSSLYNKQTDLSFQYSVSYIDIREVLLSSLKNFTFHDSPDIIKHIIVEEIQKVKAVQLMEIASWIEHYFTYLVSLSSKGFRDLFAKVVVQLSTTKAKNSEFTTPLVLSKLVKEIIDIKPGQSVCDPFAGFCILLGELIFDTTHVQVHANEINRRVGTIGIFNLLVNGANINDFTFRDTFSQYRVPQVDWIISNPPFSKTYHSSPLDNNQKLNIIELIYNSMHNKSRALLIIADSLLFSQDKDLVNIRKRIILEKSVQAVISLPSGTFQPYSGAAASILVLDKNKTSEQVYFLDLSSITKDELEFKSEEIAGWVKRKKEIDKISALVSEAQLENDPDYNLSPRRNILIKHSENNYIEKGTRIKDLISKRINSYNVSSSNLNEEMDGVPYLRVTDLVDNIDLPYIIEQPSKYVSDIEIVTPKNYVEEGCIAVSKVGNNLKPSIYRYNEKAIASSNIICFKVDESKILPEYLVKELNADYVKVQLDAIINRASGPVYYREKDILNIKIVVPPLSLQKNDEMLLSHFQNLFNRIKNNVFHNAKTKIDENQDIPVKEKEIISSIKHRIAQYVSPVSSDLENLQLYFKRKCNEKSIVTSQDKISRRDNALLVLDVFNRINENMKCIGVTFDLMDTILYSSKKDTVFEKCQIDILIKKAYSSVIDRMKGVIFNYTADDSISKDDLNISIDKDQIEELLRNFFINSIKHGFDGSIPKKVICVFLSKNIESNMLEINLINNGKPFPDNFTLKDFTSFGTKGNSSEGTGIGGYLMKKIIENHSGKLEWQGDENLRFSIEDENDETIISTATVHFKISLPYINN